MLRIQQKCRHFDFAPKFAILTTFGSEGMIISSKWPQFCFMEWKYVTVFINFALWSVNETSYYRLISTLTHCILITNHLHITIIPDLQYQNLLNCCIITLTSYIRVTVSNHRQLVCLFNNKHIKGQPALQVLCRGIHRWISLTKAQ